MPDGQPQTQKPQTPRYQRQVFPQPAGHHLAQVNLARAVDGLDQPAMAEFMAALNKVNGIAERSPGFVWRQDEPVADAAAKAILADPCHAKWHPGRFCVALVGQNASREIRFT